MIEYIYECDQCCIGFDPNDEEIKVFYLLEDCKLKKISCYGNSSICPLLYHLTEEAKQYAECPHCRHFVELIYKNRRR